MKEFDKYIKKTITEEEIEVPSYVSKVIEDTLEGLPEKEPILQKHTYQKKWMVMAASVAFFFLVFMPNVSVVYAQTLQGFPIIGDIVKVFTIRKEIYEDENHELKAEIPKIEAETDIAEVNLINKDIEELTTLVIQKFYEDIELSKDGYGSIYIDYEVITNDESWFTLKLSVNEVTGSSDSYARFYHIDRTKGIYVHLNDILNEDEMKDVETYLINTMQAQMEQNEDIAYFLDDEIEIEILREDSNFYFNENKDLVIVYNKYDIAPGYMGCPEFVIPKDVYMNKN